MIILRALSLISAYPHRYPHTYTHEKCQQKFTLEINRSIDQSINPCVSDSQKKKSPSHLPVLGLLADKFTHQILAFLALNIHNLDTTLLQIRLAAHERLVLAEHNTVDLVKNASTGAHIARRERGVHRCTLVGRSRQAACVFESGDFSLYAIC